MNRRRDFNLSEYFSWFLSKLLTNNSNKDGHFFDKKLLSSFIKVICERVNTDEFFIFLFRENKIINSYFFSKDGSWGSTLGMYKSFLDHYRKTDSFLDVERRFNCIKISELKKEFTIQNQKVFNSFFDFENLKCIDVLAVFYSEFEVYFGFSFFQNKRNIFLREQDILTEIFLTLSYFFVFSEERVERSKLLKVLGDDIKELKNFSAILAHEIKRPLGNIRTKLNIFKSEMKDQEISDTVKSYFNFLDNKLEYLNGLINSMLNYSNFYFSDHQTIEEVNLNHLIKDILSDFNIATQNIKVNYPNLPTLWIDPTSIRQIFENIIDNAIKNIDKKKNENIISISFDFISENKSCKFFIYDNGLGIKEGDINKIFELFQRSENDEIEGMGIGLAMVKKIVDFHGGNISVESKIGVGTTFFFELPM